MRTRGWTRWLQGAAARGCCEWRSGGKRARVTQARVGAGCALSRAAGGAGGAQAEVGAWRAGKGAVCRRELSRGAGARQGMRRK